MFKLSEIKELIKLVDQTSVQELEIENEGSRLFIRKPNKAGTVDSTPAAAQSIASPTAAQAPIHTTSEARSGNTLNTAPVSSAATEAEEDPKLHRIVSPMVGTFYQASSPESAPFVNMGDKVEQKTIVCIVEAMKLMNEIEAEVKGEIIDVLVENGQLVEYGQPLFLVRLV